MTGTKVASISQMITEGTALARLRAEMAKCVIRCGNCHRRKTILELGWYRARLVSDEFRLF